MMEPPLGHEKEEHGLMSQPMVIAEQETTTMASSTAETRRWRIFGGGRRRIDRSERRRDWTNEKNSDRIENQDCRGGTSVQKTKFKIQITLLQPLLQILICIGNTIVNPSLARQSSRSMCTCWNFFVLLFNHTRLKWDHEE
jgi:hypothetical protein